MDLMMLHGEAYMAKQILEKRGEYTYKVAEKVERDFKHKYHEPIARKDQLAELVGDLKQVFNMFEFLIVETKKDMDFLDFEAMGKGLAKVYSNVLLIVLYLLKNLISLFGEKAPSTQPRAEQKEDFTQEEKRRRLAEKEKERYNEQEAARKQKEEEESILQEEQRILLTMTGKDQILGTKHSNLGDILNETCEKMNRYDYTLQFLKKSKRTLDNDEKIMEEYKHGYEIVDSIKNQLLGNLERNTKRSFIRLSIKKARDISEYFWRVYKESLISRATQTDSEREIQKKIIKSLESENIDLRRQVESMRRELDHARSSKEEINENYKRVNKKVDTIEERLNLETKIRLSCLEETKELGLQLASKEQELQETRQFMKNIAHQNERLREQIKEMTKQAKLAEKETIQDEAQTSMTAEMLASLEQRLLKLSKRQQQPKSRNQSNKIDMEEQSKPIQISRRIRSTKLIPAAAEQAEPFQVATENASEVKLQPVVDMTQSAVVSVTRSVQKKITKQVASKMGESASPTKPKKVAISDQKEKKEYKQKKEELQDKKDQPPQPARRTTVRSRQTKLQTAADIKKVQSSQVKKDAEMSKSKQKSAPKQFIEVQQCSVGQNQQKKAIQQSPSPRRRNQNTRRFMTVIDLVNTRDVKVSDTGVNTDPIRFQQQPKIKKQLLELELPQGKNDSCFTKKHVESSQELSYLHAKANQTQRMIGRLGSRQSPKRVVAPATNKNEASLYQTARLSFYKKYFQQAELQGCERLNSMLRAESRQAMNPVACDQRVGEQDSAFEPFLFTGREEVLLRVKKISRVSRSPRQSFLSNQLCESIYLQAMRLKRRNRRAYQDLVSFMTNPFSYMQGTKVPVGKDLQYQQFRKQFERLWKTHHCGEEHCPHVGQFLREAGLLR